MTYREDDENKEEDMKEDMVAGKVGVVWDHTIYEQVTPLVERFYSQTNGHRNIFTIIRTLSVEKGCSKSVAESEGRCKISSIAENCR